MNMFQTNTNLHAPIIADEKEALLDSVINLLREKGFIVILLNAVSPDTQIDLQAPKQDALSILRMASDEWPIQTPIQILNLQAQAEPISSHRAPAMLKYA